MSNMSNYPAVLDTPEFRQELTAQRTFMTRIYAWMSLGLAITAAVAIIVSTIPALTHAIAGTPLLWVLFIVELVIAFSFAAVQRSLPPAACAALFILYSAITGATFSILFLIYRINSIGAAFIITAGTFGAMSVFGMVTKKDLSGIGSFCFMGLIGVILASVVSIFIHSSLLDFVIDICAIIVFVGLTAYDTQKLKRLYASNPAGSRGYRNLAIYGAFDLYLDFINLFLFILSFMGNRRD